jgi:hypothetical protein
MTAISRKMIKGAVVLATVLALGGVAQAADSNDRIIPPSPADVAILRGLLALQHPSLRTGAPTPAAPAAVTPTASTEPGQPSGQTSSTATPQNDA